MSPLSYNTTIQLEVTAHPLANSYGDGACSQSLLNMNLGQYHHRPQAHGLPLELDYSYDGSSIPSSQTQQLSSNDGLPRTNTTQHLMNIYPTALYNYTLPPNIPMPQAPSSWRMPSQSSSNFDGQITNACYGYGGSLPSMGQISNISRNANIPRSWVGCDPNMLNDNALIPSFEANAYMLGPTRDVPRSNGLPEDALDSSGEFSQLNICRSPKFEGDIGTADIFSYSGLPPSRIPASESSDDSRPGSREMTAVEPEDSAVEEPYAKLIYRALMSKPDHAMVLQEIYQWFRDNTTKGASDTKGWMNSIRHNLSMNAAFKKTERKIPGEETKKSTEWVLEEFAIKDGVQSTTRYRKGNGCKKFFRSDNPTPSRQSSGRKGGLCSSKGKMQRQRIKDERSDLRLATPRFDHGGRTHLGHGSMTPQIEQRQTSPLTPTPESMPSASPYFMPKLEFDLPYEDMCSLEDVQGVYADDTPLFSNNHGSGFHPMCASRY